jgi:hypothetical protein
MPNKRNPFLQEITSSEASCHLQLQGVLTLLPKQKISSVHCPSICLAGSGWQVVKVVATLVGGKQEHNDIKAAEGSNPPPPPQQLNDMLQ